MPLFLVKWSDRTSVLLERADAFSAQRDAKEIADGDTPLEVVPVAPNTFTAEVWGEDPCKKCHGPELRIEALPHVEELLLEMEDGEEGDEDEDEDDDDEDGEVAASAVCGEEAEDDSNAVVTCVRKPGHFPAVLHRSATGLEWGDS